MPPKVKISPKPDDDSIAVPDTEKIQRQMQKILDSPEFQATQSQRDFFRFVISETVAGRSHEIKGYTVATRVFGRNADFDPNLDPIVSIQANKLRRALERYYLTVGQNDAVRIDIPKGAYVPTFQGRDDPESERLQIEGALDDLFKDSWPKLQVQPFKNQTGDPKLDYIGIGLATELALEITRYQEIRVLMQNPSGPQRRAMDAGARFAIYGSFQKDVSEIKVNVGLVDTVKGIQIWGDTHRSDLGAAQMINFQEKVARMIAAQIAGEYGVIPRTLSMESQNLPPSDLHTYQAFLRYYDFNAQFSAESFLKAFEALELATTKEPACGPAWSMLGRLYAVNRSLELFDLVTSLEDAYAFAEKGVQLVPANQRARLILGFVKLLRNDLAGGLVEADRALILNPNSLIFLENIGYLMTLCGDWKHGPALIRKTIQRNPYYSVTAHYALWVDCIRRRDDEQAHLETLNFRTPMLFWDPLMRAATYGLLGRIDEGRRAAVDLLALKPDFMERGRVLMEYYIKFEEIVERVIDGLSKAGLTIS